MSVQAITQSFRKLRPEAKIRLLQDLWDEIAGESDNLPLSDSNK